MMGMCGGVKADERYDTNRYTSRRIIRVRGVKEIDEGEGTMNSACWIM